MTDPELYNLARAESERRKRNRIRSWPLFGDWLPVASPSLYWRWAWQILVQGIYDLVTAGTLRKVMIFLPPRHGKSEMGTVRYPVYRMERAPHTRTIVAAYGQTLGEKFSRKSRRLARDRGILISKDRNTAADWETTTGGGIRAVGVGGSVTGMGADLIFIDDPVRSRADAKSLAKRDATWDWYCDDIYTRLEPGGAIILQMTRWDEDDLAGRILASEDGPNWLVVKLPAIAEEDDPLGRAIGEALCPERWPIEVLRDIERVMRLSFAALYQQRPTAAEGGLFKRDWFKCEVQPAILKIVARVRYWDLAATEGDGDWTAGALLGRTGDRQTWVEDLVRGQWGPTERDRKILATTRADPPGTHQVFEQEPGSAGVTVRQSLAKLLEGFPVESIRSVGSKELRAEPWASQLGADTVRLKRGRWNSSFIAEHVEFPNGKHDDQVDAGSGAYSRLIAKRESRAS